MLNKKELSSFQKDSVIEEWFNSRSEELYILNDVDKEKIAQITKGIDTYEEVEKQIRTLPKEYNSEKILDDIEIHCNKLVNIGSYENEKFYKVGFMDGINLIIECIDNNVK